MFSTRLLWQSDAPALLGGVLVVLVAAWLVVIYRRLAHRHPGPRLWFLFAPKALMGLLLLLLVFDPAWIVIRQVTPELRFLAVIDDSASMDVTDGNGVSRRVRAVRLVEHLARQVPDIDFEQATFGDRLHLPGDAVPEAAAEPRGTDLAQALVDLERRSAAGRYDGAVLLTDGGDARFEPFRMPSLPHYLVAIGNDAGAQNDIAIHAVDVPGVAETGADIECVVSLRGYGDDAFRRGLGRLRLALRERADDGESWQPLAADVVDLRDGAATVTMTIPGADAEGERRFRVSIERLDGELTHLNNERDVAVTVEARQLRVLVYARRLGRDVAELRRMLAAEPGMTLTALLRLHDEQFVGQAEPETQADRLEAFPESAGRLQAYRCLVIGAFPADAWTDGQMQAVVDFVSDGGAVVFLGGDHAFGRGGYADTPLQPLFPWVLRADEPEPVLAPLEAGLAPAVTLQGVIPGWADVMRTAHPLLIHSMNRPGRLRAGAIALMNAWHDGEQVPVIALQTYGRGRVMGIATDTLWRWRLAGGNARAAYDHFWSNSIRFLAGREQGGRLLRVAFDRDVYHPGERAAIRLQVPGEHPEGRVRVRLEQQVGADRQILPLAPRPGASQTFTGHTLFTDRGTHTFTFSAWIDQDPVETFTRHVQVGSHLNEGANIYVDRAFLDTLAARTGESVIREDEPDALVERIGAHRVRTHQHRAAPVVEYRGIYLLLILIVLTGEWLIRRRHNLF